MFVRTRSWYVNGARTKCLLKGCDLMVCGNCREWFVPRISCGDFQSLSVIGKPILSLPIIFRCNIVELSQSIQQFFWQCVLCCRERKIVLLPIVYCALNLGFWMIFIDGRDKYHGRWFLVLRVKFQHRLNHTLSLPNQYLLPWILSLTWYWEYLPFCLALLLPDFPSPSFRLLVLIPILK